MIAVSEGWSYINGGDDEDSIVAQVFRRLDAAGQDRQGRAKRGCCSRTS